MKTYLTLLLLIGTLFCHGQNKIVVKLHDVKGYEGYTDFADQAIKNSKQSSIPKNLGRLF